MATNGKEYTFLNVSITGKVSEEFINRAVRVKKTISDKIGNVFRKNEPAVEESSEVKEDVNVSTTESNVEEYTQVPSVEEVKTYISELVDETPEKLQELSEIISKLAKQVGVKTETYRKVLFTGALADKVRRVNEKWFGGVVIPEDMEETTSELVGEPEQVSEAVQSENAATLEASAQLDTHVDCSKTMDLTDKIYELLYGSSKNLKNIVKDLNPKVKDVVREETMKKSEVSEKELVSEPQVVQVDVPSVDEEHEKDENSSEEVHEEDAVVQQVVSTKETNDNENLSLSAIQARMYRFVTEMESLKITNSNLKKKLEDKSAENAGLRQDNEDLNVKESELQSKISRLTQENARLTEKNRQLSDDNENGYANLKQQVVELTEKLSLEKQAHSEDVEHLRSMHEAKIAELTSAHSAELDAVTKKANAEIREIFQSINGMFKNIGSLAGDEHVK